MTEDLLSELRAKNPGLAIFDARDPRFAPYGRILGRAGGELSSALAALPIPDGGNTYTASESSLERVGAVRELGRTVFGGMDWQAGFCNGTGRTMNAFEYHKCSEVNCSATGCVLLMALPGDIRGEKLDSASVTAFYLPPEYIAEIYPLTLHFAPCRVSERGFNCLVMLERGVNAPLERTDAAAPGEEKMLWMRGKWLIAHGSSPQAAKGAYVGVTGKNIEICL